MLGPTDPLPGTPKGRTTVSRVGAPAPCAGLRSCRENGGRWWSPDEPVGRRSLVLTTVVGARDVSTPIRFARCVAPADALLAVRDRSRKPECADGRSDGAGGLSSPDPGRLHGSGVGLGGHVGHFAAD